jgi:flavin reductase (DIM6/NTAB) family NADH-FMN oxidoreductase RutF
VSTDEVHSCATAPAEPIADGIDPAVFKSVFRRHPAGVAVVTLAVDDQLVGFTATSVISVSADPPVLVFSIDSGSSSWRALARARTLVVNFLAAGQVDLSARFATTGVDRFAEGSWSLLPTGEPVLDDSPAWLRGEILERTPVGRSFLVSVRVLEAEQPAPAAPLVYHDRTYHSVGDHTVL